MKKLPPTLVILLAMALGVTVGYATQTRVSDPQTLQAIAGYLALASDVFLTLIKMIIAPLVFSTLVVGVAHMGDASAVGRIFLKSLAWFMTASLVSLAIGLVLANLLQPGAGLHLPLPDSHAAASLTHAPLTAQEFVRHLVPSSFVDALARNEILQIVVFSLFFGVATAALGERARTILAAIDELSHVVLKVTAYIMRLAPIAVFAAMAATITVNGVGILARFAVFMTYFYVALVCLWCALAGAGYLFLGRRVLSLLRHIREAFLVSFATASSEAAYPKILAGLDRFGVPRRISSFVMPLGYSFNLDGSMMYCTFAALFIAQAYGIHLSLGTQIAMLLVLMLTSKGMAGVPRASLVVIAATLSQFHLPEAGVLLILGIDSFLDMGRSATNAVGNSLAAAVVAKLEGELRSEPAGGPAVDEPRSTALALSIVVQTA